MINQIQRKICKIYLKTCFQIISKIIGMSIIIAKMLILKFHYKEQEVVLIKRNLIQVNSLAQLEEHHHLFKVVVIL